MKQVLLWSGQEPNSFLRNLYQQLPPRQQIGLLALAACKLFVPEHFFKFLSKIILLFAFLLFYSAVYSGSKNATTLSGSNHDYTTVSNLFSNSITSNALSTYNTFTTKAPSKNLPYTFAAVRRKVPESAPVTVTIAADRDNAIFSTSPTRNDGSVASLRIGRTGPSGGNTLQRALFHFDLSGIPSGSIITSATLTLDVGKSKGRAPVALHKLKANWGETESTWSHTFLSGTSWNTPGGDFEPIATATTGDVASATSLNIPDVTADVQAWVNNSAINFGWILKVIDEAPAFSAKIIFSREHPSEDARPVLSVTYTPKEGWDQRYGGLGNEGFTTIIKTTDGGYLSGGYTNSGMSGDKTQVSQGKNDYWIVKSDANGKKLWDKQYGGTSDDYLNRIILAKGGGYLLAGSSLSGKNGDKTEPSRGDRDYWIVRIDKDGNKLWDKRYGGTGYDELKKVMQLSTGEYILAGYSNSPAGGDKTENSQGKNDFWIIKINSTGTKIWDKRYGGNLNEALGGIVQTTDEGFFLGGSSDSGISGNKSQASQGGNDFWLLRTDKNGNQIWDKTYGGSGQDEVYSVGKVGSFFIIAGQSDSPADGDKTLGSQGGKDFWFMKVSGTGAKIWDQRFGGSLDEELRASTQAGDGGYLLAGKSFSNKSGDKTQDSQGNSDYWVVKTDANGKYQWDKRYGGSNAEELRAIIQGNDGSFLLAGKSSSGVSGDRTQPSQGGTDYWLVKVASLTTTTVAARTTTVPEEEITKTAVPVFTAFPNPFQEYITVSFTLPHTQPATVKVYDSQGREVNTLFQQVAQANQTYKLKWHAGKQANALYFLQLQTPSQQSTQRVIRNK